MPTTQKITLSAAAFVIAVGAGAGYFFSAGPLPEKPGTNIDAPQPHGLKSATGTAASDEATGNRPSPSATDIADAKSADQQPKERRSLLFTNPGGKMDEAAREALKEERMARFAAQRAERRELAKTSPEVVTKRLAARLRLDEEKTAELGAINERYSEDLNALDAFQGSDEARQQQLRQIESVRFRAMVPIVQESPALVEPMNRFTAIAEAAGAQRVQPPTAPDPGQSSD